MIQRTFTLSDQQAFAALSGDFNPLHVDPLVARRLMFGRVVVHGIHLVLWALDAVLPSAVHLTGVNLSFKTPVGVGDLVDCRVVRSESEFLRVVLTVGETVATRIDLTFSPPVDAPLPVSKFGPPREPCRERGPEALQGAEGIVDLGFSRAILKELFPSLGERLEPHQLAVLLACTRLVGMECPGLHSIFTGLKLEFLAPSSESTRLRWRVRSFDSQYSVTTMEINALGMQGTITAFLRPAPQAQPAFTEVRKRVGSEDVFRGQRALVLGGSRGLGELCAKILAAGGAEVRLTYHHGEMDARKVVAEIVDGGGRASCIALDVLNPSSDFVPKFAAEMKPTHLYYFPTPKIAANKTGFSADLFNLYCSYYVTAFLSLASAIRKATDAPLRVFYPSSTFVDEAPPEFAEYAVAKAAGEAACRFLAASDPGVAVAIKRLPKLPTDQTLALIQNKVVDPIPVLLSALSSIK